MTFRNMIIPAKRIITSRRFWNQVITLDNSWVTFKVKFYKFIHPCFESLKSTENQEGEN